MKLAVRSNVWYVRFDAEEDGRLIDKRISTKVPVGANKKESRKEALKVGAKMVNDYLQSSGASTTGRLETHVVTLGDALDRVWRETWSKSKSAVILQHVIPRLIREVGHWNIRDITTKQLKAFAAQCMLSKSEGGAGMAPSTTNRRLSAISKALRVCVDEGELTAVPNIPHYKEANVKDRYLSPEEETVVLSWLHRMSSDDAYDSRPQWVYLHDLIVFLIDTGFRWSEAYKFVIVDGCAVLKNNETKNGSGRVIPLTKRAMAAAQCLLDNPLHARVEWAWVSHRFDRCMDACHIEGVTLHTLRHTCASRLVQRGISLYDVKHWMGHNSITTTERYAHLAPETLQRALRVLETHV